MHIADMASQERRAVVAQPFASRYGRKESVNGWTHSLNGRGVEDCHALAVAARSLLDLG